MATHNNHPPAPSSNQQYANTDHRPDWVFWYALIYGAIAGVIGWVASPVPFVFIGLMALGLSILWFLRRYGRANGVPRLAAAPTQDCLTIAIWVIVAGGVGWIVGMLPGAPLLQLVIKLTEVAGITMPIMALVMLALASIGLLLAAGYRARTATIVCVAILASVVMFMPQQASGIGQTPFQMNKTACEEDAAKADQDFAVGC